MTITGAHALLKALEREGVDIMFGIPGGASLPTYDPLLDRASATSYAGTSKAPGTPPRGTRGRPARSASHGHVGPRR